MGRFDDPVFYLAARFDAAQYGFEEAQNELRGTAAFGYRPVLRSAYRVEFSKGKGDFALKDGWETTFAVSVGF